jgi:hypothetical protein
VIGSKKEGKLKKKAKEKQTKKKDSVSVRGKPFRLTRAGFPPWVAALRVPASPFPVVQRKFFLFSPTHNARYPPSHHETCPHTPVSLAVCSTHATIQKTERSSGGVARLQLLAQRLTSEPLLVLPFAPSSCFLLAPISSNGCSCLAL